MKYTVITSFNQEGLKQYGQRMIDTFEALWPAEVDLIVCAEDCKPQISRPNSRVLDLINLSAQLRAFIDRHRNNPLAHGQAGPPEVFDPRKTFRWHAQRFAYKVYSVALCERYLSGWMIWLDADTHTHSKISLQTLHDLCPTEAMIAYLGRGEKYHSECGWVAYNLSHPDCRKFIHDFVAMYDHDDIFRETEWHDSYIWDIIRKRYQNTSVFHNLNTSTANKRLSGHPFINSELGRYMDHAKGNRKLQGHSRVQDIQQHLDHPYWNQLRAKAK